MMVIASLLFPYTPTITIGLFSGNSCCLREQLFGFTSDNTPHQTIVGVYGSNNLLLPEYPVSNCFIIPQIITANNLFVMFVVVASVFGILV